MRFNEQWPMGLFYKSEATLNLAGAADFAYPGDNPLAGPAHLPQARNCSARATMQLPDSLARSIAYKPLENPSLEVGTVWTRWSVYNALNIYFDRGYGHQQQGMARRLEFQRQRGISAPGLVASAGGHVP